MPSTPLPVNQFTPDRASHPIQIQDVRPSIDSGRYPVKREVGDELVISADVFREGHDQIRVAVQYRPWYATHWRESPMHHQGNDLWTGSFIVTENARHDYRIVAWPDRFGTWRDEVRKKADAGLDLSSELLEGAALLESIAQRDASGTIGDALRRAASLDQYGRVELLLDESLAGVVEAALDRQAIQVSSPAFEVIVDRVKARYAAWYEIFPRSAGSTEGQTGTFDDVIDRLEMIAGMGFDVLYFPPIHPIGEINRKGPNNAVISQPGDPGSPYAIGAASGGHDAIEPSLGTLEDFHRLVEAAGEHGLEIALDFAIQAAPDHPWAADNPSWFHVRPDGTIKYAENPPKKYEDIYPINFGGNDWSGLWQELRRVFLFWIDQGVSIFRVDNPHTKPFGFWEWVIREIQELHPQVIFLSEAFTRPKIMSTLAKAGFTQSYSYFTWRNDKQGLTDYFQELTSPPVSEYMRTNLFPTTPDILPVYLQQGGAAAFKIRLTLAATLSSVYGMYSGYELCEGAGIPGKEEFINSEKYELKVWDWERPGNIRPFVTTLNVIRQAHPALHEYDNLRFHWSGSDQILVYSKADAASGDAVLVVVNLDPFRTMDAMIYVPPDDLLVDGNRPFTAHDLLSGERYDWHGGDHYVRLDPAIQPVHVLVFEQE
ncbi:MAG: alpha-1,4-glucan--maltose-1-phosphate maltosyltransferase [Thermomicrobiales bacterium]|nr:alpha-1,4-glucan--maltose-1-phosphate maltosyltransferase [Thermomicrobiales bacterium]